LGRSEIGAHSKIEEPSSRRFSICKPCAEAKELAVSASNSSGRDASSVVVVVVVMGEAAVDEGLQAEEKAIPNARESVSVRPRRSTEEVGEANVWLVKKL
jgi:protein-arginine kinase activator protein McsA